MTRKFDENGINYLEDGENKIRIKEMAKLCILAFLGDKKDPHGLVLAKKKLLSDFAVNIVLRAEFDELWEDVVHQGCLPQIPVDHDWDDPTVTWQMNCLIEILQELNRLNVPKEFQAGLILLYFRFCFGFRIPEL